MPMKRSLLAVAACSFAVFSCYDGPPANAPQTTNVPIAEGTGTSPPVAPPTENTPPPTKNLAALHDPSLATARAPETFQANFKTTKGTFTVEVHRSWAPNGANRFYNLLLCGFFDGVRFFRAIDNFMVQFGINGNPAVSAAWKGANIPDDPVNTSNTRGKITFAQTASLNSRTTQMFINYKDNSNLDAMRFAPFGEVVAGMAVVDAFYKDYGEGAPGGKGPNQARIQAEGNAYLQQAFPELDSIESVEGPIVH